MKPSRSRPRRLLTIGHSYGVALNRRLPDAVARVGAGEWEVTVVAPSFFHGDLRPVSLEPFPGEVPRLEPVATRLSRHIHVMHYGGRLREILGRGWDVVHCWEEPYIVSGAQVARLCPPEAALVYYTFQNISKRYPPPFNWMEDYSMRRADGWISGGESGLAVLEHRRYYSGLPRRTLPLGVDDEHFRPEPAAGREVLAQLGWDAEGPPVVGFLGRFVPEKGIGMLTRVLDRLAAPWRALLIGGGEMEGELRAWADGRGDRVRVVTGVRHEEVPAYLNAMNVLCAPSQTARHWREQLGRMLIEGFACGVPVIASDSGEIPAVVGDAGVIVGEADEQGWVAELTALLSSPERRAELADLGLQRACSVFSWEVIARRHLEFFSELSDARQSGARRG